jgi:putative hydrolase of the HAD superfamily
MKVIYFDCFGVLSSPILVKVFEKYIDDEVERQIWVDKLTDLDLGTLSEDDLIRQLSKRTGATENDIWVDINNMPKLNHQLLDYIRDELKSKYTIGLLTNITTTIIYRIMSEHLALFDITLISSELGLVKPDPRVFQIAIEKAGVDPSEILFIDDREENVLAAQALGINGIVYTDFVSLQQELLDHL